MPAEGGGRHLCSMFLFLVTYARCLWDSPGLLSLSPFDAPTDPPRGCGTVGSGPEETARPVSLVCTVSSFGGLPNLSDNCEKLALTFWCSESDCPSAPYPGIS